MKHFLLKLVLLFILLISSASLYAQGCAACKTNAAQAGAEAQRGLRRGIAVLLVPSLIIFCALVILVYKHREATHD